MVPARSRRSPEEKSTIFLFTEVQGSQASQRHSASPDGIYLRLAPSCPAAEGTAEMRSGALRWEMGAVGLYLPPPLCQAAPATV